MAELKTGGHEIPAVIAILTSALGERAGGLVTALAAMAMWFCGLSAVTWTSRVIFALAWRSVPPEQMMK